MRRILSVFLSAALVFQSLPSAAQFRSAAPAPAQPSLPAAPAVTYDAGAPLQLQALPELGGLSSDLSSVSSAQLGGLGEAGGLAGLRSADELGALNGRAALDGGLQPLAQAGTLDSLSEERGALPLSDAVWSHAESRGYALGAPSISADASAGSVETLAPLHAAGSRKRGNSPLDAFSKSDSDEPQAPQASPAWKFIRSFLFVQVGVEALALAIPQLAKALSDSFWSLSMVSTVSFAALSVGSFVGGPLVDRLGFRKVYTGIAVSRGAAALGLAVLHATGTLNLPLLTGIFALDYLLHGVGRVGEGVVPAALYGSKHSAINRFGAQVQMMVETVGILAPLAAGYLVTYTGFGPLLWIYPALMLATAVSTLSLKLPDEKPTRVTGTFESQRMKEALKAVFASPILRSAALGYALVSSLTYFLYFFIGPAAGLFIAGEPNAAAGVTGWIFMLYASGGLAGTGIMAWMDHLAAKRLDEVSDRKRILGAASKWLAAAALSILAGSSLFFGVSGPLAYALMLPFGLTAAGVFVHLETLIKTEAPADVRATVLGAIRAVVFILSTLGFVALGWLFEKFSTGDVVKVPTVEAFLWLGGGMLAVMLVYLWVAKALAKEAKKA